MANKIIDIVSMAIVAILLCATTSRGAPLTGADRKTAAAMLTRSEATYLMPFLLKTHDEFEKQIFKNGDYDHHYLLKEIEQVTDKNISKKDFLKAHIILLFKFHHMLQEMIANEAHNPRAGDFKTKFTKIDNKVSDLYARLGKLESLNNLPHTAVSVAQYPIPTVKPKATQKEQDEWSLTVLHEILLDMILLQRGLGVKFVF